MIILWLGTEKRTIRTTAVFMRSSILRNTLRVQMFTRSACRSNRCVNYATKCNEGKAFTSCDFRKTRANGARHGGLEKTFRRRRAHHYGPLFAGKREKIESLRHNILGFVIESKFDKLCERVLTRTRKQSRSRLFKVSVPRKRVLRPTNGGKEIHWTGQYLRKNVFFQRMSVCLYPKNAAAGSSLWRRSVLL